jgi:hypothetical protein
MRTDRSHNSLIEFHYVLHEGNVKLARCAASKCASNDASIPYLKLLADEDNVNMKAKFRHDVFLFLLCDRGYFYSILIHTIFHFYTHTFIY